MIDDWAPEPLVAEQTSFEETESEKLPVIVGFVLPRRHSLVCAGWPFATTPEYVSIQPSPFANITINQKSIIHHLLLY